MLRLADYKSCSFCTEVRFRVVRQTAQTSYVLALLVIRMADECRIVLVYLPESQQVQFLFRARLKIMLGVVGGNNTQSCAADGDIGQYRVSVFGHQTFAFGHSLGWDVVKIRHAEMRPICNVFLALATGKAHRYGEAGTSCFDTGSCQ